MLFLFLCATFLNQNPPAGHSGGRVFFCATTFKTTGERAFEKLAPLSFGYAFSLRAQITLTLRTPGIAARAAISF